MYTKMYVQGLTNPADPIAWRPGQVIFFVTGLASGFYCALLDYSMGKLK